ncbi:MAG: DUF58 domain-containing protein [Planctomycetes bacterium]|nr:DUF58 domain-containing protein [Planctomycetota bacterium]
MPRLRVLWSRVAPRLPRPTAPGVFAIILSADLFLTACFQQNNLLIFLACTVAAACIWSALGATFALAGLRIRRHVPPNVFAGEPVVIEYVVGNASRGLVCPPVRMREVLAAAGRATAAGAGFLCLVPRLAGRRQATVYADGLFRRRGVFSLTALDCVVECPFGLFRAARRIEMADEVIVYPALGHAPPGWRLEPHALAASGTTQQSMTGEGEFAGLREYRPGDPAKWIHWKHSARLGGRWLVREFDWTTQQGVVLLVDLAVPTIPPAQTWRRADLAASLVATLARSLHRDGHEVTVRFADGLTPEHTILAGGRGLEGLWATLATLPPGGSPLGPGELAAAGAVAGAMLPVIVVSCGHPDSLGAIDRSPPVQHWVAHEPRTREMFGIGGVSADERELFWG